MSSTLIFAVRHRYVIDAGIDVAGAGAHHQALHRRQAHRGVHGTPADDRRRRRAVAQVQHDLAQRRPAAAEERRRLLADVLVRRAVKPVAADVHRSAMSRSMAYVAAAAGRSWKNAVSNTATCGRSGSALRATSMPSTAGGLCSGASGASSSSLAINASSTSVGRYSPARRAPPGARPRPGRRSPGRARLGEHLERVRSAASWSATGRRGQFVSPTVRLAADAPRRSAPRCRRPRSPRIRVHQLDISSTTSPS